MNAVEYSNVSMSKADILLFDIMASNHSLAKLVMRESLAFIVT